MQLLDQVAIVTGAGQGIGQQIALRLAQDGARVILADINEAGLANTSRLISSESHQDSLGVPADVSSEDMVRKMVAVAVERFGRVDILVNNSGIAGPSKPVEDITLEEWDQTMSVNLRGVFLCCKYVVPIMKNQRSGSIINISSITGKLPLVCRTPYAASKIAVIGLTRTLAAELGEYNIRVNALCPGSVEGTRLQGIVEKQSRITGRSQEQIMAAKAAVSPLQKLVDPRQVAAMVAYLCSADAAVITGQDINVCGGVAMQ